MKYIASTFFSLLLLAVATNAQNNTENSKFNRMNDSEIIKTESHIRDYKLL